jgi:release factor glutamine methyltransferase
MRFSLANGCGFCYWQPMASADPARWTVLALLNWTRGHLQRAGADSPRLAAEVLLAHALGWGRIDLYTRHDYLPAEPQLALLRDLVTRAARREPVAYLVGEKEFYSLPFLVTPDVLIPRPETEILVEQAVGVLRALDRPGAMWDICTGSGCVAVATARQVQSAGVLATDVSPAAVEVARKNVARHGLEGRVQVRQADLLTPPADWPPQAQQPLQFAERLPAAFDVITANPPYVPDEAEVAPEVSHEPAIALRGGADGLDFIRRIIEGAPRFLRPGGALVLEFGADQGPAVRDLLAAAGSLTEPRILRDHRQIERAVLAVRKS